MLSPERLRRYRRMSPSERWAETVALMAAAWEALRRLPREERERRLAIAQRGGLPSPRSRRPRAR